MDQSGGHTNVVNPNDKQSHWHPLFFKKKTLAPTRSLKRSTVSGPIFFLSRPSRRKEKRKERPDACKGHSLPFEGELYAGAR